MRSAQKKVLCATGGAAGLYRPNNPGFSRHKMWYPPFNTGAGYAMGLRCGAEMTTFEMRFIALRCKDTIAPTRNDRPGRRSQTGQCTWRYLRDEIWTDNFPASLRYSHGEQRRKRSVLPQDRRHFQRTGAGSL